MADTAGNMETDLNIVIDTDPGTDDALALGMASVFFRDNIRAAISSYGNTDGEQTYKNLINLAGVLDIKSSFIKGSLNPLTKNNFTPTDYHGKNGLCGLILPEARRELCNDIHDFLSMLYDVIKKYKNIKYIAVAPLTNLALLFEKYPDSMNYIEELIIMGGGFEVSNMRHKTEYNFYTDSDAVEKVLAYPIKKIIAPLDMTHQLAFSLEDVEDITDVKRDFLFGGMSDAFTVLAKLFYLNYETSVKNGNQGAIIHDAATLAYLLDKSKCDLREHKIISDEYGAVHKNQSGYAVTIIERIDKSFVKNIFKQIFQYINNLL